MARSIRRTSSRRAFTLIEVLAVVVVLGIVSTVVMSNLSPGNDVAAASAARNIMADVAYAQNQAITAHKNIYVRFDTTANNYALYDVAPTGTPLPAAMTHPVTQAAYSQQFGLSTSSFATVSLDNTTTFDGQPILMFDSLGTPHSYDGSAQWPALTTGAVVLHSGSESLTLLVEPDTGEISTQ